MNKIYALLVIVIVLYLAYHLIPIAYAIFRIIIGIGVLIVFASGIWVGRITKNN